MKDAIIQAMAAVFERSESDVRSTVGERDGCILTIATETGVLPDPWSCPDAHQLWMEVQRRLATTAEPGVTPCYWDSINAGLHCWYPVAPLDGDELSQRDSGPGHNGRWS